MRDRTSFIRSDIAQLTAYISHSGGESPAIVDRLDTNESPLDLPADLKSKLAWIYQEEIEANRYPDGSHEELKRAIAEYANESAHLSDSLTVDNISVGNGSDELIRSILIATCLGGEGSILVATPTFSVYGILAKSLGIEVVTVERNETDFALDLSAARQAIEQTDKPPIRVVFMVHPNSPTGNALAAKELDWLRSLPDNILVVVDEAYFEFSQTSVVGELPERHNWMVLRTFSKAFRLAAHRVGYAIASPDFIKALEKVRLPYNLPSFSQIAAKLVLQQRKLLLPLVEETIEERKRIYQTLQKNSHIKVWQSDANFLYLRLKNISSDSQDSILAKLTASLKTEGTLIRHTGGGLRITIGTPEESDRFVERLQKQVSLITNK